ncbi:prealbumin-like fold domain-containing protein [Tepidiforma flava]|uniref:Prealbumin-like fold domain-containing protein n=1 Tax=Tepidiforma flava TaxID=3004094 RepID=A0ABY7M1T6_9CHLR|nr:prealbumin-like fold domain-containing protein [Tepidiforma flava]WBL34718.1 prealbumin-like fold domain-containing protein [Tepidiforma flava]
MRSHTSHPPLARRGFAALALLALAAAAFFAWSTGARARVPADGGVEAQQSAAVAVLKVCKMIQGVEGLDGAEKFEIQLASPPETAAPHYFYPVIERPGPNGMECQLFEFDAPAVVLVTETYTAGYVPSFTYQPYKGSPSSPAPLPASGLLLYLYPNTCSLEKLERWDGGEIPDPACTVTIINGRAALTESPFVLKKAPVQAVVDDPADIQFDISLFSYYRYPNNQHDSLHIDLYDPNVSLVSGPVLNNVSCGTPPPAQYASHFEGLLDSPLGTPVAWGDCKSIGADIYGLSMEFRVAPRTLPQRTCEDQVITNTVAVRMTDDRWDPIVDVTLEASASVILKGDPALCPVTIRVVKTLSVIGFSSPGAGWEFTLEGCGVGPLVGTTDANGVVEFPGLPPAVGCSYTVTETVQAGWVPQYVSQQVQPREGGSTATVEFLNIREFNPPCVDPADPRCQPPEFATPTPPATPAPPAPIENPTSTPSPSPTTAPATPAPASPSPSVTSVSGGILGPTPRPPATGTGAASGEPFGLLPAAAGLIALSSGLGLLALARRRA